MAGNDKNNSDELGEFVGDLDELDIESLEEEVTKATRGSKLKSIAWRRLEQRADNQWLDAQLADWNEYFDIH